MAEFCNQCAKDLLFEPGDFAGRITEEKVREGFGSVVLCEGCGVILVDHEGNCISVDCPIHGHK